MQKAPTWRDPVSKKVDKDLVRLARNLALQQESAGISRNRQELAGIGRNQQESAGKSRIQQESAGIGRNRQESAGISRNQQESEARTSTLKPEAGIINQI